MPTNHRSVKSATKRRRIAPPLTVDCQGRDFLTEEAEMQRFLDAARHGRHGVRDHLLLLLTYRHGLRVSEAIDLRLKDFDLGTARLFVRRKKGSLSTHQPLEGEEIVLSVPGYENGAAE